MRKNSKLFIAVGVIMASVHMVGCGVGSEVAGTAPNGTAVVEENVLAEQTIDPIDIQLVNNGKAYSINEKCNVLENYGEYNVQANLDEVYACIMKDNYESIEFSTHSVSQTDDTNSSDGKYDVLDKINVKVAFSDNFGVMPQSVTREVLMAREAASGNWEVAGATCKKWEAKYKKFGGTSWKMTTENGDVYFRLRDTIEFFTTQPGNNIAKIDETEFSTTILGAIYMNVDGENVLKRMHVIAGKLSDSGDILLHIEFPHTEEEAIEIDLNDCELIERDELPFSEEEFRETSDQIG